MDLHIDDFCQDVARILVNLYQSFPRAHGLYVEDIWDLDTLDEVGLHSRRHNSCLGAMLWLAEEGYLRYHSLIYREGIDQAVLTSRAFLVLSAASDLLYEAVPERPASVKQQRMTRIEQLRAALHSGNSQKIADMVRYILSVEPHIILPDSATEPVKTDNQADNS